MKDRTVLVTGATRGIGRELVKLLCARGASVFATGRDAQRLASLQRETGCAGIVCDLAQPAAAEALYAAARETLGRISVLVNNAGFNPGKRPLVQMHDNDLDASYAVNVRAPALLCRAALREMAPQRHGHIVNVISTIARTSVENNAAYCSMKHALHGFTLCLIKEARLAGVKVTGVYPGGTDTDFRPEERPDYMRPESAARMIADCIDAPEDVVVHELVYRPLVESNF